MSAVLITVPVERVRADPQQIRKHFDPESIEGLAASIAAEGLQQPVLCRPDGDRFVVIDGERRLRAHHLLKLTEITVLVISDPITIVDTLSRQLACNLHREELSVIERADAIQSLMQYSSMTAEQVAKRLGWSPAKVSRTLSVLKLPEVLRAQVARGEIGADVAYLLARIDDPNRQAEVAAEVAGKKLTRDGLARKLRRARASEPGDESKCSRITATLGKGRSLTASAKGLTLDGFVELLELALVRAKKARTQGLTLATFIRTLKDQATS